MDGEQREGRRVNSHLAAGHRLLAFSVSEHCSQRLGHMPGLPSGTHCEAIAHAPCSRAVHLGDGLAGRYSQREGEVLSHETRSQSIQLVLMRGSYFLEGR